MTIRRSGPSMAAFISGVLVLVTTLAFASEVQAAGIVSSIRKAPVVADGDVTGRPTDYVITFSGSLDHNEPGRALAAGDVIRVILPPEFDLANLNPAYPLLDAPTPLPPEPVLSDNECVPAYLTCSTAVILHGWPQHPFFPPVLFHTLSIDPVENSLTFTAVQDMIPNPPSAPGIKQLHLILNGVTNPAAGLYRIQVEAQTGPDGAWETGSGFLRVRSRARPSINVTSVFVKAMSGQLGDAACGPGTNPPNPDNPIFQSTAVSSPAPFPWTFLLWDNDNQPLADVSLQWITPQFAKLKQGRRTVGFLFIDAPFDATGYGIDVNPLSCPTSLPGAPVIAGTPGIGPQPVGRLDMQFQAGDIPGDYTTTILLRGGRPVQMVVTAVAPIPAQ